MLSNFSTNSSDGLGTSGWRDTSPANLNEWNWTTAFGMNPPESSTNSFETTMITPPGWSIEGTWPDGWEVGTTRSNSGWGPGLLHSGDNGAAINLTTKYTNNVYTHLVTEEYTLPTDATGRLTFRSWVCTEPNWDGGGVGVSTDGGLTWWLLPPQLNGLPRPNLNRQLQLTVLRRRHHRRVQRSQRMRRIHARGYDLKTYDLSNLSGQSFKLRFSFFSDTFVEEDGWYIDDAGVEFDVLNQRVRGCPAPSRPTRCSGTAGSTVGLTSLRAPRFCSTFWIHNSSPLKVIKPHASRFTGPGCTRAPNGPPACSDGHRRQLDAHGPQSERGANHVHRASTRDEHRSGRHQRSRGRQRPTGRFGPVLNTVAFRTGLSSRWLPVDHRW